MRDELPAYVISLSGQSGHTLRSTSELQRPAQLLKPCHNVNGPVE